MASPPDLSPGSEFAGHRILAHLVSGDSAEVFRVEQSPGGTQFALKVMGPAFKFRGQAADGWAQAATVGAQVGGEHVVYCHAAGVEASGLAWVAMEFLEGETLTQLLDRKGKLAPGEAADLLAQVADSLGRAHAHGVTHGELSSDNVFLVAAVGGSGKLVKLLNLGLAAFVRATRPSGTARLGTPEWLAPEETRLGKGISPATDVWALGLLAFRILVGISYWKGIPGGELIRQIGYAPMSAASARAKEFGVEVELPEGFDEWFLRCVERDPHKRYRDAVQAVKELDAVLPGAGARAPASASGTLASAPGPLPAAGPPIVDPRAPRAPAGGRRDRSVPRIPHGVWIGAVVAVALFVLLGLGAGGVWYYLNNRPAPPDIATLEPIGPSLPPMASHGGAIVPVWYDDPTWGYFAAPVTIIMFTDLQCPFCARSMNTLDQVKAKYGMDKVRIVWKHLPLAFHEEARPAAEAASAVYAAGGSDAFWQFVRLAFSNRRELTRDNFTSWAAQVGVDQKKYNKRRSEQAIDDKIDADAKLAAELGIKGTPTFLINGVLVRGAQEYDKFVEVIDEQLVEASELQAGGTPPEQVYPLLMARHGAGLGPDSQPPDAGTDDAQVWQVPVLDDDPQRGPDDALVTIVEFSDFQCPFCKRVRQAVDQVVDNYGDDVRVVWKDNILSFHERAEAAAVLARVAYKKSGDAGFWKAHDALFESAPQLEDSDLQGVAKQVGVSWPVVAAATAAKSHGRKFKAGADLARELKAGGIPHFFINGRRFKGAQPYEKFRDVIDEELAKAKALVAGGTPRAEIYKKVMEGAKAAGQAEKRKYTPPPDAAPMLGPLDAKVTVRLFGDYQCPYCARVMPTVDELMTRYPGKIRLVWHDFPLAFHKQAKLAAEAAHEVFVQKGAEAFWKYHKLLLKSQVTPGLERSTLEVYARTLDVDIDRLRKALDDHTHAAYVERQMAAAREAEIKGTPATLINGYYVGGAQSIESFTRVVDAALAE